MKAEDVKNRLEDLQRRIECLGVTNKEQTRALLNGDEHGKLSSERALSLVSFDADAIQEHVFASPRPVTILGASAILRTWDLNLQKQDPEKAVVLFAGGGQAVLLTRKDNASVLRQWLEKRFDGETFGSSCTTAQVDLSPRELAQGPDPAKHEPKLSVELRQRIGWSAKCERGFGACMALLAAALRREKGRAKNLAFASEAVRTVRCSECAERPRFYELRCERCQENRIHGQREKKDWDQARSFEDVLFGPVMGDGGMRESGSAGKHLAFLRLDGAGIGGMLEQLSTMAQYATVSLALGRAFAFANPDRELEELGVPSGRYQLPIAGGDDLLLVVPARWHQPDARAGNAFSLCLKLIERIQGVFESPALTQVFQKDPELLKAIRSIGAGAGIVVSSGIPARFCFDYALELVRSSKEIIAGTPGRRSAVDFAVLYGGSPLASSVRELRELPQNHAELDLTNRLQGRVRKTARPYSAERFTDLLACVQRLSTVPRSSLHALRTVMDDPQTGLLNVKYRIARDHELRRVLSDGGKPLASLPPEIGPWVLYERTTRHESDPKWVTPIPDLLEMLPFIDSPKEIRT